jgi:type IV secretory pathway VirB4 component
MTGLRYRTPKRPRSTPDDQPTDWGRPRLWRRGSGVPVDWARSTMAHLASVYPFQLDAGFGERGPLLGVNVTGGFSGFFFDPFELYATGLLTNPNMVVLGHVGFGKSSLVKAFLRREVAVYGTGRFLAVIDPKGEYGLLADDLGMPVVKLHPGGTHHLNPMDSAADVEGVSARQRLASGLVAGVLERPLSPLEDAVLGWAVERASREQRTFTLVDLASGVLDPAEELVRLSRHSPLELARATAPVSFALDKLCSRSLRGMFDQPTNVTVDWANGPGVILDLSAVYHNTDALPLVMLAATHWLSGALRAQQRLAIQVVDEAWAAVACGAAWFQASLKLARAYGIATVLVCHRPADLTAQADDGTSTAKIAAGLMSDIQTRVLFHQPPEQVAVAADLFDLSDRQRGWLGELVRGRAIWQIGGRCAVVHTDLTADEARLFDSDRRMRGLPPEFTPADDASGGNSRAGAR